MSNPNFLLISVDSLRRDFCSFLNGSEDTMDFLEDLAEKSTVFEQAISPSVWTLPVHTSIFTGLYPAEHQVNDENTILGNHPTVAELLQSEGYETRSFTHNGWFQSGEMTRGFDHDHTRMPGMVGYGISHLKQGIDEHNRGDLVTGAKQLLEAPLIKGRKAFFRHRFKGRWTMKNFFNRIQGNTSPFCYIVHLNDVHHVYRPHIKYYREFGDTSLRELHQNVKYQETLKNNLHGIYTGNCEVDQQRLLLTRDLYRASILQVDSLIKRIVERLKTVGKYENTVLILFGDHGDLIGERGMFGHSYSLADELIRVPLLIHDPTGQFGAERRSDIVQLNDIYPTILEMAGLEPPETNSISLFDASREAAYVHLIESKDGLEYPEKEYPPFEQYGVWKSPSSKLVHAPEADKVREAEGESRSALQELDAHLDKLTPVSPKGKAELTAETRSQLEDMGYL